MCYHYNHYDSFNLKTASHTIKPSIVFEIQQQLSITLSLHISQVHDDFITFNLGSWTESENPLLSIVIMSSSFRASSFLLRGRLRTYRATINWLRKLQLKKHLRITVEITSANRDIVFTTTFIRATLANMSGLGISFSKPGTFIGLLPLWEPSLFSALLVDQKTSGSFSYPLSVTVTKGDTSKGSCVASCQKVQTSHIRMSIAYKYLIESNREGAGLKFNLSNAGKTLKYSWVFLSCNISSNASGQPWKRELWDKFTI